jgi:hypothetical protein
MGRCPCADAQDAKKATLSSGFWDSIHVVEVRLSNPLVLSLGAAQSAGADGSADRGRGGGWQRRWFWVKDGRRHTS